MTAPTTEQARVNIDRTPGGVEVVPDTEFKNGPANTIKDVLSWVPGVVSPMRWGPRWSHSTRGSGLTRNFGNRGINLYMDGIPINTADGLTDLFEVDPTAYRYVEVFNVPMPCALEPTRSAVQSISFRQPVAMLLLSTLALMAAVLATLKA